VAGAGVRVNEGERDLANGLADAAFQRLFETGEAGEDSLPEGAARHEPRNAAVHVLSLSLTKLADGLLDPKLVLSWLVGALGAPALFAGLLVPIREAGALLPQLFAAAAVQAQRRRGWIWATGSLVQGVAALGIALTGLTLTGAVAGALICLCLAVLAVARSFCSASYKDILGRTVAQTRRGTVTGLAASTGSVGVVVFAGYLIWVGGPEATALLAAIALAALFWIVAAMIFYTLKEIPTEPEGGSRGEGPLAALRHLRDDPGLARFVIVRGLLTATALAPPFLVLMAGERQGAGLGDLGVLVLASALASLVSSYIWGREADRSSRRVLIYAGLLGALALGGAAALWALEAFGTIWVASGVLFALMIAYHGVRQGRSTYLVDYAPEDQRAAYTAVANTLIGTLLLVAGAFGGVASLVGAVWAVVGFAVMCALAAILAIGLPEAEAPPEG